MFEAGENYPNSKRSLPSGYRPITVLPVASKIIEVMLKQLLKNSTGRCSNFLKPGSCISKWSTVSVLIRVLDDL